MELACNKFSLPYVQMTHIETRYFLEENYCEKVVKRNAINGNQINSLFMDFGLFYIKPTNHPDHSMSFTLCMWRTRKNGSFHFPPTLPSAFATKIKFYTHSWRSRLGYSAKHEKWYIAFLKSEWNLIKSRLNQWQGVPAIMSVAGSETNQTTCTPSQIYYTPLSV